MKINQQWIHVCNVNQAELPGLEREWKKDGKAELFRTGDPKAKGRLSTQQLLDSGEIGIERFSAAVVSL